MCVGGGSRLFLSMRFNTWSILQQFSEVGEMLVRTQGPTMMAIVNGIDL